jgi:MFS transporter, SP family, sugar:H+ symporter
MELSVMPIFMSEIMPAPIRGITVGSYQFSLVVRIKTTLQLRNKLN